MSHYQYTCEHGTVMGQCRCPGPKTEIHVACEPSCPQYTETITDDRLGTIETIDDKNACKFRGPYDPVGDIDWICETHGVSLYRRPGSDVEGFKGLYCPVGEPDLLTSKDALAAIVEAGASVKMIRETLCFSQAAVIWDKTQRTTDAGRRQCESHLDRLQRLIDVCDQLRPLGTAGKHGKLHTRWCGCENDANAKCENHNPQQHCDGKPPWCRACGLTASFEVPVARFGRRVDT